MASIFSLFYADRFDGACRPEPYLHLSHGILKPSDIFRTNLQNPSIAVLEAPFGECKCFTNLPAGQFNGKGGRQQDFFEVAAGRTGVFEYDPRWRPHREV